MTTITLDILKYAGRNETVTVTASDDNSAGQNAIRILEEYNAMKIGGEFAGCIVKQIIIIRPTTEA